MMFMQVFCTSASVIEMDNPSHWMKFCARVDKVTFTDNEDYRAAVCNNLYETVQGKRNILLESMHSTTSSRQTISIFTTL